MTQTNEFNSAVHGSIASAYQSFQDGKFNVNDIVQYWIDDIARWQTGLDGFAPGPEVRQATNEEMQQLRAEAEQQLQPLPADDRYDIAALTSGLWSAYRMIARKSFQEGEESALRKLQEAGVIMNIDDAREALKEQ